MSDPAARIDKQQRKEILRLLRERRVAQKGQPMITSNNVNVFKGVRGGSKNPFYGFPNSEAERLTRERNFTNFRSKHFRGLQKLLDNCKKSEFAAESGKKRWPIDSLTVLSC